MMQIFIMHISAFIRYLLTISKLKIFIILFKGSFIKIMTLKNRYSLQIMREKITMILKVLWIKSIVFVDRIKIYKLDDSEKLVFFLMLISEQLLLYFLNYFYF